MCIVAFNVKTGNTYVAAVSSSSVDYLYSPLQRPRANVVLNSLRRAVANSIRIWIEMFLFPKRSMDIFHIMLKACRLRNTWSKDTMNVCMIDIFQCIDILSVISRVLFEIPHTYLTIHLFLFYFLFQTYLYRVDHSVRLFFHGALLQNKMYIQKWHIYTHIDIYYI